MRIDTLRIPCKDLDESEKYYATVLRLTRSFGSAKEGYIGFRLENGTILLEPMDEEEFVSGRYLGFSLRTEDIRSFYDDSRSKGITFTGPPMAQPWGGIMTHVEDCNGNIFSIVQVDEG